MQENANNRDIVITNFWGKKFTVISAIGIVIALIIYIIALPYIPEEAYEENVLQPEYYPGAKPTQVEP